MLAVGGRKVSWVWVGACGLTLSPFTGNVCGEVVVKLLSTQWKFCESLEKYKQ